MMPPIGALEAGQPPTQSQASRARKRKKTAPQPAYTLPTPAAGPAWDNGKALQATNGQLRGLNNMRNQRLRTVGGYGT